MLELTIPFARAIALPRFGSWLLAIAVAAMLSMLPINFDRQMRGLGISPAQAAIGQCALQPLMSSSCPRVSCIKPGPATSASFTSRELALNGGCTGKRRG
jgi:hypothetical protein